MKEQRLYFLFFSAVTSVFCFPPFKLGPLIFVILIPLLYAVEDLPPSRAFKYGLLWGIIFNLGYIFYIAWVTIPGMFGGVLLMSMVPATAFWFYAFIWRRSRGLAAVFLPAYFLSWNWLFTMSDMNYPWMDIGYALGYYLPFIQAAEIGGVYLISLVILAVNTALYCSASPKFDLKSKSRAYLRYGSVLMVLLLYFYGAWRLPGSESTHNKNLLTVGLLQGNLTRDIKWKPEYLQENFNRYFDLSRKAADAGADILIWPETATPTYLVQDKVHYAKFKSFVDSLGTPILTGTPFYETVGPREYIYFNSAVMVEPDKAGYEIYRKIHLVPVSEKIPFSGRFKILKEIRLGQADWSSGVEQKLFEVRKIKFGTVICIESVYPGYCRDFVRKGARFLVVITNDMWFGRTSLLEQHAMMSVFRAVENRVPVVRAANTGISMAIDKWGRIHAKSDIFTEEYIIADINPEESDSVYRHIGDVIPRAALIIAAVSLIIAFIRRKRYIGVYED